MAVDRDALAQVQGALEQSIERLDECEAPSGIAAHVQMALDRLKSHIAMLDRWENGSAWDE